MRLWATRCSRAPSSYCTWYSLPRRLNDDTREPVAPSLVSRENALAHLITDALCCSGWVDTGAADRFGFKPTTREHLRRRESIIRVARILALGHVGLVLERDGSSFWRVGLFGFLFRSLFRLFPLLRLLGGRLRRA